MTYNEIIDVFKKKVQGHFFINEFGYGDISDISTPDDGKAPYYPYIFLNPVSVTSNDRVSTFNFNLICMTQCRDDQYQIIKKQSDCIDNLRDVIAQVNNTLVDPLVEIQPNYTFTPFKERFQDDVVGASCNITVTYPSQLDACNTPIADPNYCLIADTFNGTTAPEFNTTYTFGGWGYFKYTKEEFNETANPDDEYFEFICDTRYAWFISTEKKTVSGGDQLYPVMAYIDTGYPTSDADRLSAFYIFTKKDGTSFECGSKSSFYYKNADLNAVSYVNTTNDNGWVIPTEGWVRTFDPDDSQDRTGNVYIFETDCTDPKPSPTAAPLPPPSPTPTPSVSITPTPSITPSITPSVTTTVTPSVTATVTPTPSPTPEDCSFYDVACVDGWAGPATVLNGTYHRWTRGELDRIDADTFDINCDDNDNTWIYTGETYGQIMGWEGTSFYYAYAPNATIACGERIDADYDSSSLLTPFDTCGGDKYADLNPFSYGAICPSPTPTPTSSVTPTITPSITPSVTSTVTPSVTNTPSVTTTPSVTATPSVTITPSVTTTPSVTITPTITPTSTITPTPTPTPSPIFYHIEAQNGDLIITQAGDNIDWFPL